MTYNKHNLVINNNLVWIPYVCMYVYMILGEYITVVYDLRIII